MMSRVFKFIVILSVGFGTIFANDELFLSSAKAYLGTMKEYNGASNLANKAKAVLIFPSVKKVGFIVGGMKGSGIALINNNGKFSPYEASISNGSIGLQIGYEDNAMVLFIMSEKLLSDIKKSKLTLGGDVTASAGKASANIGVLDAFSKDVYVFVDKGGLFAGVSLGGVVLELNQNKPLSSQNPFYKTLIDIINQN